MTEPLLLSRRCAATTADTDLWRLALSADERTRLRGLRRSVCGRELLLQLPRGEALLPGERLATADGIARVQVEAAAEALLVVSAADSLDLLRAAYHLGNRHVSLEVRPGELRLLEDPVLAAMLQGRGLSVQHRCEPFLPEAGAYAQGHHHHAAASEPR